MMRPSFPEACMERPLPAKEAYEEQPPVQRSQDCTESRETSAAEADGDRRVPLPGTAAERLHGLYLEYIRYFPAGTRFSANDWSNTPQKENALEQLFAATETYCCGTAIRPILKKNGIWPSELETETLTVFHDAFLKILTKLFQCRKDTIPIDNYAALAVRICRNWTIDYLKVRHADDRHDMPPRKRSDYSGESRPRQTENGKEQASRKIQLVDPYRRDEEGCRLDEALFSDEGDSVVTGLERKMDLDWMEKILYCYVREMLDYDDNPEKVLGLCYGRVLYQMVGRFDPEFGLPEEQRWNPADPAHRSGQQIPPLSRRDEQYKQPASSASARWAMQQMTDRTFEHLRDESEREVSRHFGFPLRWGETFRDALRQPRVVKGNLRTLAEICYDELCTLEQVRAWCSVIHNTLLPRVYERIMADENLVQCCVEHLPTSAKKFLDKGAR